MAYLNKQERDQMAEEIKDKSPSQIRGYVNGKDKKARLAYWRNVQESGKWMTRYIMDSLGTMVTIYETFDEESKGWFNQRKYRVAQIVVEPSPNNRT
ncbi:MAG: hypothetical protein Q9P01_11260 [Anaerolineae bacterium]|nr:hypothetical protein [Anaerolineae bacterium]MDQ7035383.1 hypothetical protein [Anaerolineae bacterium]